MKCRVAGALLVGILLLSLMATFSASAQDASAFPAAETNQAKGDENKANPSEGASDAPKIEIEWFPADRFRVVGESVELNISVTNTSKTPIVAEALLVCLPETLLVHLAPELAIKEKGTTVNPKNSPVGKDSQSSDKDKSAQPPLPQASSQGTDFINGNCIRVKILSTQKGSPSQTTISSGGHLYYKHSFNPEGATSIAKQVSFRRDQYPVQILFQYKYKTPEGDPREGLLKVNKSIEFKAPLIAPLVGVFFGALLAGLFLAYKDPDAQWLNALLGKPTNGIGAGAAFNSFIRITTQNVVSGIFSGFIIIVILNQTEAQQLPITVSINDAWGGAFLGLMSHKLSNWLYEKFFT